MARFQTMYTNNGQAGPVIEADSHRGHRGTLRVPLNKEVVRTLKVDLVGQIKRLHDDEEPAEEPEDAVSRTQKSADAK